MRRQQLKAKVARKFKANTQSNHNLPLAPNLLKQQFTTDQPNEASVTDITYLATDEGWLDLAVTINLFSRQVVGWAMDPRMTRELVINALEMAIDYRQPSQGLIVHSDRGSQCCSEDYQQLLKHYDFHCSTLQPGQA